MKKVTLKQGKVTYELGTGLGFWAESTENQHLDIGDVRLIGGILMSIYMAKYGFSNSTYTWTPVDNKFNTFENQSQWKNNL